MSVLFNPSMTVAGMTNFGQVNSEYKAGRKPDYWPRKIMDTGPRYNRDALVGNASEAVRHVFDEQGVEDEALADDLMVDAIFGLLAGWFEQASGKAKNDLMHPLIWNAIRFQSMTRSERDDTSEPAQRLLRELGDKTLYLCYFTSRKEGIVLA